MNTTRSNTTRLIFSRDALKRLSWRSFLGIGLCAVGETMLFSSQAQAQPELLVPEMILPESAVSTQVSTHHSSNYAVLGATQLGQWLDWFRPPSTGQPRSTGNGSSREGLLRCSATEPAIQPLLPVGKYGLSLAEHPRIFVDVSGTTAQQALLVMRSEDGLDYRQAFLPVPEAEGFSEFSLPEGTQPLATNQTYQWSLSFICGDYFTLNDPTITGWVRRIDTSPAIEQAVSAGSPQEQAQWLSENGYWYDLTAMVVAAM